MGFSLIKGSLKCISLMSISKKWCQLRWKVNMGQNQKLVCTWVNKKKDKEYFLWLLQIHNYLLSQPAKPQRKIWITFKNMKFSRQRTLSLTEHTLLERLCQFIATANLYLDTVKKLIFLLCLVFLWSMITLKYFKIL